MFDDERLRDQFYEEVPAKTASVYSTIFKQFLITLNQQTEELAGENGLEEPLIPEQIIADVICLVPKFGEEIDYDQRDEILGRLRINPFFTWAFSPTPTEVENLQKVLKSQIYHLIQHFSDGFPYTDIFSYLKEMYALNSHTEDYLHNLQDFSRCFIYALISFIEDKRWEG